MNKSIDKTKIHREPKRVCAVHDLSSFGRCALTVVIPTLSALGIQTVPLPTALMSTHTGGYSDIHIRDLSSDMVGMYSHWQSLGIKFDAIYSGFVLDASQGQIIESLIKTFEDNDTLILVDPVMGDDGVLYSTCTAELKHTMLSLCSEADIITPNLTEACILTDTPYPAEFPDYAKCREFVHELLSKLTDICGTVAMTGICCSRDGEEYVITACTEKSTGKQILFEQKKIGAAYPGTGELFSSVLLGLILDGTPFFEAAEFAGRFVAETINLSELCGAQRRYGTALEPSLMKLSHDIYEKKLSENKS